MILESLLNFMLDYNRQVHTIKPAVVTSVNLETNTLSAKILTSTKYKDGFVREFPDVIDVPFMVISGKKGLARITVPVSVGDNVIVLFSDRDLGSLLTSSGSTTQEPEFTKTHDYYPVMALPCFFTEPNAKVIDPDKIVIENNLTSVKISPTGEVEIVAPTTMTITTPALTVNCPATVFTGTIAAAGILPTPGASIIEMEGTWNHSGSYILNGIPMETHKHTHGSATTSTPIP